MKWQDARTRGSAAAEAGHSKAIVYRKRTNDVLRRMTIYLPEELSRRLRIYAATQDLDYSVVLGDALADYLEQKGG